MLKYMRSQKNLSQNEISKIIGVARNTVSQYETETIQPTFDTIEKIANVCDYKIYFENKKTKEKFEVKNIMRKDLK